MDSIYNLIGVDMSLISKQSTNVINFHRVLYDNAVFYGVKFIFYNVKV